MKKFDVDSIIINRYKSKIEFLSNEQKVEEEALYRTLLNLGEAENIEINAKDTKNSLNVSIKFKRPMKCTITKDESGYTIVKCEEEQAKANEFEYEETPSKSRLIRDEEMWG